MDLSPHIAISWKKTKEICLNPTKGPLVIGGYGVWIFSSSSFSFPHCSELDSAPSSHVHILIPRPVTDLICKRIFAVVIHIFR